MSDTIIKKERNLHDRIRKRIVLGVTSDKSIMADRLEEYYSINRGEAAIQMLYTDLKGSALKRAVDHYMKEKSMRAAYGDRVIYLDEELGKGGGDIDCTKTE